MFILENYTLAVAFCIVTMICWGSWANTQKLTTQNWRFELFYWDYVIGILLMAFIFALTFGSTGDQGRNFLTDISQGDSLKIGSAIIGGVIFNISNILLIAAIAIAGMSVAFPVGIGIALILGVIDNYADNPIGNPTVLFTGVGLITLAILLNAFAYKRLTSTIKKVSTKGLVLSVISGVLMGKFYGYVADSMVKDFSRPEAGSLTPYTAVVFFAIGIFASNFLFNTILMRIPIEGQPVSYTDYFKGSGRNHLMGVLGGFIWCIGMSFSIIASGKAGPAISYGLGQGATVIAALWGIFVWREFKEAPKGVNFLLYVMLGFYIIGLGMIIVSRSI